MKKICLSLVFAVSFLFLGDAFAAKPEPWQMGFQEPATPVMERLVSLHDGLLWMVFGISGLVLLLLLYVIIRFNAKANPVPSKTSHNALIEVIWTVIPVLILVAIIIPSWRLIHYTDKVEDADITIKAIGYQWYWGYEYMDGDGKGIAFESYMKTEDNSIEELRLQEGEPRLLEVDRRVVIPVDTTIRFLTTAADVIHGFAMPAFGIKMDAIPGRINETWAKVTKTGVYYGQCSELCGSKHAFMPIAIEVVEKDEYKQWVKEQGGELIAEAKVDGESVESPQDGEAGDAENESQNSSNKP